MRQFGGKYMTELDLKDAGFRKLGNNVKIHNRASIYGIENISIANNVRIDDFSIIIATGEVEIGNYVSIHNFCYLGATHGIFLGDFVTLAPSVKIFTASDDYCGVNLTGPVVPDKYIGGSKGKVIIKKHVIIGAGSVVMPTCTIEEGCAVGALSFVNQNLEPWGIYAGIPTLLIKERKRELLILEKQLLKEEKYYGK